MDAMIEEIDRLRRENHEMRRKIEDLTRACLEAERAAAKAGSLNHALDNITFGEETVTREQYLRGILVPGAHVYNRYYLTDELEREFRRNTRGLTDLSCVLIAPDKPCDDDCMKQLGESLHRHLRIEDVVGRWDETSFLLVLSRTNSDTALELTDFLCQLSLDELKSDITLSAGVADLRAGIPKTTAELLEHAAETLSLAQSMGGDRRMIYNRM